jgi:hypothetical protein
MGAATEEKGDLHDVIPCMTSLHVPAADTIKHWRSWERSCIPRNRESDLVADESHLYVHVGNGRRREEERERCARSARHAPARRRMVV